MLRPANLQARSAEGRANQEEARPLRGEGSASDFLEFCAAGNVSALRALGFDLPRPVCPAFHGRMTSG